MFAIVSSSSFFYLPISFLIFSIYFNSSKICPLPPFSISFIIIVVENKAVASKLSREILDNIVEGGDDEEENREVQKGGPKTAWPGPGVPW